jgi:hypothetical protein
LPSVGMTKSRSWSVHILRNTTDPPSQTQDGTLSLQPPLQEAVLSATTVTNNIPIPSNDNIEMEEVGEPPDVMEEDGPDRVI